MLTMERGTGAEIEALLHGAVEKILASRRAQSRKFVEDDPDIGIKEQTRKIRESTRRRLGIDPAELPWEQIDRHPKRLFERLEAMEEEGVLFREATAETSFGALLRYGVQNFLFDAYLMTDTIWESLYTSMPANSLIELFAPLYGAEVPEDVEELGDFDESRTQGIDVQVRVKKVGRMVAFSRELVDDDRTGQIKDRASKAGEKMRYKEEIDGLNGIIQARDYAPGSAGFTGYSTTIGNRSLSGTAALNQTNLELVYPAMRTIKDPLGQIIAVRLDTILHGPTTAVTLWRLLQSQFQPSIPGGQGGTAPAETASSAVSGQIGWTLAENWLKGRWTPVEAPLFNDARVNNGVDASGYWFVMQAKKGAVHLERDPLEVVQENPLSGMSFTNDAYRYRVRRRYAFAVIEPRYIYQGNGAQ